MNGLNLRTIATDKIKLTYVISFAALGIFAYLLLVQLDLKQVGSLSANMFELKNNLETLKKIEQYNVFISEFDKEFIVKKDANWLIDILTQSAAKTNLMIEWIKPLPPIEANEYAAIRVALQARSSYIDMIAFLTEIENHKPYLFIEDADISESDIKSAGTVTSTAEQDAVEEGETAIPATRVAISQPSDRTLRFKAVVSIINGRNVKIK